MSLKDSILEYFEKKVGYFSDTVDFSKLSTQKQVTSEKSRLRLVIDADSCMVRLTGGLYPDWQSGGQWQNLFYFIEELKRTCVKNSFEIIIFFNGTLPDQRTKEWQEKQTETRRRANRILNASGKQKLNWIEPILSAQNIIFELNFDLYKKNETCTKNVFCYNTFTDHRKDIINFCIQNECDGLLSNDFELITFAILNKKYENLKNLQIFSANLLKLSHKNELTSMSYNFQNVLELFKLNEAKFGCLSMLLGFNSLRYELLKPFYKTLVPYRLHNDNELDSVKHLIIEKLINYIQSKPDEIEIDDIINDIFKGLTDEEFTERGKIFREVHSYLFSNNFDPDPNWVRTRKELESNDYLNLITNTQNGGDIVTSDSEDLDDVSNDKKDINFELKIKQLHVNCVKSPRINFVLKHRQLVIPSILEYSNYFKRADEIFKLVRENSYSILFSGQNDIKIEEIRLNYETYVIEKNVVKVVPVDSIRDIDHIWKTSREHRRKLFMNCIGSNVFYATNNMFKETFDFFVPCIVLRFMIREKLLNMNDIKAFLATFEKSQFRRKNEFEGEHDLRACNLANIFLSGVEHFMFANEACGNPIKFKWFHLKTFFDGNKFQSNYHKAYAGDPSIDEKVLIYKKNMFDYVNRELKDCICQETFNTKPKCEPVASDLIQDEKPKIIGRGRGLLIKNLPVKQTKPIGFLKNFKNDRKEIKNQFDDSELRDTRFKGLNRHSSPKEKSIKSSESDSEDDRKVPFPIEHFKLQEEVMELMRTLESKKPKPPEKRFIRYQFHDHLIKKYEEIDKHLKKEKPSEKKLPEFVKKSDYPLLMEKNSLLKRKKDLLEKIALLDAEIGQRSS